MNIKSAVSKVELLTVGTRNRALARGIRQRGAKCGEDRGRGGIERKRYGTRGIMSGKVYDVTPEQREVALWRDAKRKQLREMYLRDSGHPTKSLLFDTGIYRYASAKTAVEMYFVPTAIGYITRFGFVLGAIFLTGLGLKHRREKREHMYRTGQIPYEVRTHRFC
ncbi:PREDICTED: uncharacterized protein LOC105563151 [Vollenhovia emeryi]|uniref:uncharacterized protein LOC105563151 n=1 Tax=Vollenhovia emeryi TaxID=411798 RepID=UPI0005F3C47A|nr:PREDICTED: uncharacterized protein LOC105563151 [Vollenhovia emeryi]